MKTDLAVALDFAAISDAEAMLKKLSGLPIVYKVGLELFLSAGPEWVKKLTAAQHRIFLDLKFYDIPNTVAAAVARAEELGVEFTTVHLCGGKKMFDAFQKSPKILGVSVLTSFSEQEWNGSVKNIAQNPLPIDSAVLNYAQLASEHPKIAGMVCSPQEISLIRKQYPNLYLLVPGIRPAGTAADDQARVMTPKEAAKAGASMIVVGRPITKAADPRAVAEAILNEIRS